MWCIIFPDIKNVKVKGIKMNFFRFISLLETQGGTGTGTGTGATTGNEGGWFIYVMLGLMAVWFVWSLISGKKRKKKEQEEEGGKRPRAGGGGRRREGGRERAQAPAAASAGLGGGRGGAARFQPRAPSDPGSSNRPGGRRGDCVVQTFPTL